MSFILDALKKSESDRQRQSGPALFEVKVAAPRTRLPLWAIAIAGLLAVNLAIVMWMLWRHPAPRSADTGAPPLPAPPPPRPPPPPPPPRPRPPPVWGARRPQLQRPPRQPRRQSRCRRPRYSRP